MYSLISLPAGGFLSFPTIYLIVTKDVLDHGDLHVRASAKL